MTISITFTAASIVALRADLGEFLGHTAPINPPVESKKEKERPVPFAAAEYTPSEAPAQEEAKSKKTRGPNKKKDEAKVEAPQPVAQAAPTTEDATLDTCRQWIKQVAGPGGENLKAAQEIVISFGIGKVGELPESKYADFISECKKALEPKASKNEDMFA